MDPVFVRPAVDIARSFYGIIFPSPRPGLPTLVLMAPAMFTEDGHLLNPYEVWNNLMADASGVEQPASHDGDVMVMPRDDGAGSPP